MNILLVGGRGFIGGHLLPALLACGHSVIATSRTPSSSSRWQVLDLARLASEPEHFHWPADLDLLINAAGVLSPDAHALDAVQNQGACLLFEQAATRGIKVLQISALGAGQHADIAFLTSKHQADQHLLNLDVPAVVLRPSLVIGPGGTSSRWLCCLSVLPLAPLLSTRARLQPLHIDDLVAAVVGLVARWPGESMVLPLVGPQLMTQPQLLNVLRAAQGWGPAHYFQLADGVARLGARLGQWLGWQVLNQQVLALSQRDNLADPEPLQMVTGVQPVPLASRLAGWPDPLLSAALCLRPALLLVLFLVWFGTALVCLGPGSGWGLRIMAEAGVHGGVASVAVISGALLDGALGLGLLVRRWRRPVLAAQLALMAGYTLLISVLLPHYWYDPYMAVGKNLMLMLVTVFLLRVEPRRSRGAR